MELKRGPHRVYALSYHLIFVIKYRRKVLDEEILTYMKGRLETILQENNGSLIEFNGEADHVHVLFEISPDINLAHWVRGTKGALARKVRETFPEKLEKFHLTNSFWTDSYFIASTGGATIETLKQYVEDQGKPKRHYVKDANQKRWNKV